MSGCLGDYGRFIFKRTYQCTAAVFRHNEMPIPCLIIQVEIDKRYVLFIREQLSPSEIAILGLRLHDTGMIGHFSETNNNAEILSSGSALWTRFIPRYHLLFDYSVFELQVTNFPVYELID